MEKEDKVYYLDHQGLKQYDERLKNFVKKLLGNVDGMEGIAQRVGEILDKIAGYESRISSLEDEVTQLKATINILSIAVSNNTEINKVQEEGQGDDAIKELIEKVFGQ